MIFVGVPTLLQSEFFETGTHCTVRPVRSDRCLTGAPPHEPHPLRDSFFLSCIAIELLISRRMGKQVYRFHDAMTSLNIGFISETIRSIVKLMTVFVYALVVDQVAAVNWDIQHPAVWIVAFFMYDFFYYWAHRSGHEVNLLWASHVVHHSSEEFNLSTALRQSWTNQIFYWIFYLPMPSSASP